MPDDDPRVAALENEIRLLRARLAQAESRPHGVGPAPPLPTAGLTASSDAAGRDIRTLEFRYQLLATAVSDAIYDHDLESGHAWHNVAYAQLVGESPGDDLEWWQSRLHPEDREAVLAYFRKAMTTGQASWQRTYRMRRSDDSYATVQDRCFILYDDGLPVRVLGALRDISDRVAADREIRRLASFPGENPNPIFVADAQGELHYQNPAGNELLARIGCRAIDVLPPSHREIVVQTLREQREVKGLETHVHGVWIQWHYHPVPSARLVHIYGIEITEIRLRENALRESEARFRTMADSAPVMIWLSDATLRRTWYNADWRRFTGEPDEACADWVALVHPDDQAHCRTTLAGALSTGSPYRLEYRLRRSDGAWGWLLESATPRVAAPSPFNGYIGTAVDITDLKTAQNELHHSRERLRFLVENLPGIVWTVDRDLRFTSSVGSGLRDLGLQPDEVLGQTLIEFLKTPAPDAPALVAHRQALLGQTSTYESDVADHHYRSTVEPLRDARGDVFGAIGIAQDITTLHEAIATQRRLEEKLQQAQKLESLGILAGGIAHDFNNLLAGIMGNAGLALMELSADAPLRPILQNIETGTTRAAELTRQMLAYSGRGKFIIEPVDLNIMTREMIDLLRTAINKNATLKLDISHAPVFVHADTAQMRQVVMNLITNASDAIGDRPGLIRLRTGCMVADRDYLKNTYLDENLPEGPYAWVEVADTGCGMTQQTLARIFDPFFTTKFTGRGLGLAAILGIIRGHRGAIKVTSALNKGTTFKVLIPSHDSTQAGTEPRLDGLEITPFKGSGTILIIDDEVTIRTVASLIVKRFGFDAEVAEDGRVGTQKLRESPATVAAILLDLTMPTMSGEATFLALRQVRSDVPIILMSGYSEQEASSQFAGKGLNGFLHKPFRARDLQHILQRVLEASQPSQAAPPSGDDAAPEAGPETSPAAPPDSPTPPPASPPPGP